MANIESIAQEIYDNMPPEFVALVEGVRNRDEAARWESGRLSADYIDEQDGRYPKTAVRMALAMRFGCSENTIRDREYIYRAVPEARRVSHPLITHRMWRIAIAATDPDDFVGQIEGYYEAWGKLPSIDTLLSWRRDNGGLDARFVWAQRLDRLRSYVDKLLHDEQAPREVKLLARWMAHRLDIMEIQR